nr:type II secretion system F family protein [uncultured Desulfobacter sp.]
MPVFTYIAVDRTGLEMKGEIEASDAKEVAKILRERSLFLVKVREGSGVALDDGFFSRLKKYAAFLKPGQYLPVMSGDLVIFYRQVALMLRAGYTLISAIDTTHELQSKFWLRRTLTRMGRAIRHGSSFSAAMSKEKKLFSPMVANLVACGEQSGNLDSILERLAENLEANKELKRQLITAMFYPCFILVASLGVVVVMVYYVIPKFSIFLSARHAELPASTMALMNISEWAKTYGLIVGGVAGAVVFLILIAYTTKPGKHFIDGILLRVPLIGTSLLLSGMARAGWTMAILLNAGITALEAMRITAGVQGNLVLATCFKRSANGLLEGRSLSRTFEQKHIPVMMRHMAAVGESSGQLDVVMEEVGEYYRKELMAKVKLMATMIEPCLILGVGGLVFYVYYALFQAVMSVSKGGM